MLHSNFCNRDFIIDHRFSMGLRYGEFLGQSKNFCFLKVVFTFTDERHGARSYRNFPPSENTLLISRMLFFQLHLIFTLALIYMQKKDLGSFYSITLLRWSLKPYVMSWKYFWLFPHIMQFLVHWANNETPATEIFANAHQKKWRYIVYRLKHNFSQLICTRLCD